MNVFKPTIEARGGRSLIFMTFKLVAVTAFALFLVSKLAQLNSESVDVGMKLSLDAQFAEAPLAIEPQAHTVPVEVEARTTFVSEAAVYLDLRRPEDVATLGRSTHSNSEPTAFYGGAWKPTNVVQDTDRLSLTVRKGVGGDRPTMAEVRTKERYGYGRYEVIMRPSGESGIVSAFFTYTGPWAGDPHDEVDIEFVGKNTRYIEFNYFRNGRTDAHKRVKLGFDAAKRMHLYAFDWQPDQIIWYVDGREIYRTPYGSRGIPDHPGQIYASAWTGSERVRKWVGAPRFGDDAAADFACISFTPNGDSSRRCADMYAEDPQFQ